jgi:two-component system sensor histidine kinase BaeS
MPMRLPRLTTLRARLFAGMAATVAASILVTVAVGGVLTRRSLDQDALRSLSRQIDLIAAQRSDAGAHPATRSVGSFLATEQERLAILTPDQAELLLPAPGAAAVRRGTGVATGAVDLHGTRYLYAARRNGTEALVLLRTARSQSSDWKPFVVGLTIAGAIGAALAALVAFALARAVARPITRVADASRRLASGEDPGQLPVGGASEVATLSASFNHLSAELARAQDAERAFLLSVSHELKTPLTAIRGHAEALVDGVLEPHAAGEVIEREAGRLERLIRDLLDLARFRRRSFSAERGIVDLGEAVLETVARFEPVAQQLGVSLSPVIEPNATATGDADRIVQAISNLVENALRCTRRGGSVSVLASAGRVDVVDDGLGIEPEGIEHAFERFYLWDRYGGERPVGTGLGLAIVRELAEAMGGSVEVRSAADVGSTFSILLPEAAGDEPAVAPSGARDHEIATR